MPVRAIGYTRCSEEAGMQIRSPYEIGQLIRSRREARGMTQADLAAALGASRKWVIEAEAGKPTAEIGRLLRALAVLGVTLAVTEEAKIMPAADIGAEIPDVNDVLANYHRTR
jgi:HTH-type transcriptional regulator/antitoxin HipB